MEIIRIKNKNEYKKLVADFYRDDPDFINNKNGLIDLVCGHSHFRRLSTQEMVGVISGGECICVAVLICHKNDPENLMMAFFETREYRMDEVAFLIDHATAFGKRLGCKRLLVGLDGHCNNAIGFLSAGEGRPCFGQSYNPLFYNDYFRELDFDEVKLLSFKEDIPALNLKRFDIGRRLMPAGLKISCADFSRSGFRRTMELYTDLNNRIFGDHRYCFFREYEEDYELFASMRPLLDGDNLLFATRQGEMVGFLLWYPDFNELVSARGQAGLSTFLRYRLLRQAPSAVKAVQVGVLSEFVNTGLILSLFGEFYKRATQKHKGLEVCLSSWILEENQKSVRLSSQVLTQPYKEMSVYERTF